MGGSMKLTMSPRRLSDSIEHTVGTGTNTDESQKYHVDKRRQNCMILYDSVYIKFKNRLN